MAELLGRLFALYALGRVLRGRRVFRPPWRLRGISYVSPDAPYPRYYTLTVELRDSDGEL